MKRFITIIAILILGGNSLPAQDFQSYKRQQQEAFQTYSQKTQGEWDDYRKELNEEFASFIEKTWVLKSGEEPTPAAPKVPEVPPVVLPEIDIEIPEDNPVDVDITLPLIEDEPIPIAPIPYKPKPAEKTIAFKFYGTPGSIRFDTAKRVSLKGTDEKAVSNFWRELSGEAYDNVVADCQAIRGDRDLCDWAYFKMTEKVAETLYETRSERAVFQAWLLTQSGFSAILGREQGTIHLLPGTNSLLFGKPYWIIDGNYYTLMDDESVSSLYIMDVQFPGMSPIRTRMNASNMFEKNTSSVRILGSRRYPSANARVCCDKNALSFLQDIPISAIEGTEVTDYLMYAGMPLSEKASYDLIPALSRQVASKNEAEAANILLNFVQTAFEYKTDGEVWGRERPFFPEETLYYPYSDCEDRAILFCSLVREVLRLDVAFVSYPGHLAAAVHFNEDIPGDYFIVNGKRYLVCDPTYINAPIGRTMPGMNNEKAKVYLMH